MILQAGCDFSVSPSVSAAIADNAIADNKATAKVVPSQATSRTISRLPLPKNTFDAGIVFSDRDSYLCLPVEQFGLPSDAAIESLKSSCECVQPNVVEYVTQRGTLAKAVMLNFVAESALFDDQASSFDGDFRAAQLGVLIDVNLANGAAHQFTVLLLSTHLAAKIVEETTP